MTKTTCKYKREGKVRPDRVSYTSFFQKINLGGLIFALFKTLIWWGYHYYSLSLAAFNLWCRVQSVSLGQS